MLLAFSRNTTVEEPQPDLTPVVETGKARRRLLWGERRVRAALLVGRNKRAAILGDWRLFPTRVIVAE